MERLPVMVCPRWVYTRVQPIAIRNVLLFNPIDYGLYFVGAGVHPGAGLPGVLSSAKVLEKVVPQPESQSRLVSVAEAVTA